MDSLSMLSPSKMVGRRGCIWKNRELTKKYRKEFTAFWKAWEIKTVFFYL